MGDGGSGSHAGLRASRSVKRGPFNGTAAILLPLITSPNCVSIVSTWSSDAAAVIASLRSPGTTGMSARNVLLGQLRDSCGGAKPAGGNLDVIRPHGQFRLRVDATSIGSGTLPDIGRGNRDRHGRADNR